ncbi:cyclophilin-like fold protein [Mailhella massiliensis]|uniref:cyclophilin-like fold protein n=1 Tax=Mailhella massiliensis TaxID=1903261 RepID=UPI0023EF61AD|nr:cyclophilin-like fold protein [Mailhella massiliensis]
MKKGIILLSFALLYFGLSDICIAEETQAKKIKLLFAGEQAVVVLDDHPAVRDLLSMLPMTVTFEDYNGIEKISYLQRKLHTEGSPSNCDPSVGTFAYYAPWGNLSVFYQDFRHSEGLVPLGRIESGMNSLARMQGDFSVRLEIDEQAVSPK